jgi:hypothetical protein
MIRTSPLVRPVPGRLIDHDMDMTDTGRHFERLGTKHRQDPEVHRTVLNVDSALAERAREWRVDDEPRRRLRSGEGH